MRLLKFFTGELPQLALTVAGVPDFSKKKNVDLTKMYKNLSGKMHILLKSFSANYTRLLTDAIQDSNLTHLSHFFTHGSDMVGSILPFKIYLKKLGSITARITAMYSRVDKESIVLAFNTLRHLVTKFNDTTLFESVMKKLYNEFTRECKIGGGGLHV